LNLGSRRDIDLRQGLRLGAGTVPEEPMDEPIPI
jgi:hypothetical protein